MKVGLIYQPCGLGDILFCQKIAHVIKSNGYEVYWPVISEFDWIGKYIPHFHFVSWEDSEYHLVRPPLPAQVQFPYKEIYLPETPTQITSELCFWKGFNIEHQFPHMKGKYESIGLDWRDWRDHIHFDRNHTKEDQLYYEVLGLKDNEDYVFVNRNFMTRPMPQYYEAISVNPDDYGCRVVELQVLKGFSLFDWCKVLERAVSINMIETSLNYLMESPQLFDTMSKKKLFLHHRTGNWQEVRYLFNLPWHYF